MIGGFPVNALGLARGHRHLDKFGVDHNACALSTRGLERRRMFWKAKPKGEPLPEPPNPLTEENTVRLFEVMDDALVTAYIKRDEANTKEMEWYLASTVGILTGAIATLIFHPAPLPGSVRFFIAMLALSTAAGIRAKVMNMDPPETISQRSDALEQFIAPLRPPSATRPKSLTLEGIQEAQKTETYYRQFMEYCQYHWYAFLGKTYTKEDAQADLALRAGKPIRQRDSQHFAVKVRRKALWIKVQWVLAGLGFVPAILVLVFNL
jgi:hypothetical protein